MKMTLLIALAAICCNLYGQSGAPANAISPNGRNEIRLWANPLAYEVSRDGVVLVARTEIGMKVNGAYLKGDATPKVSTRSLSGTLETPVYKKAKISLAGKETFVDFGDWGVRLAARDDGVAWRFETKMMGRIKVDCEKAALTIPRADAVCSLGYAIDYGRESTAPFTCLADKIGTGKDGTGKMVNLPFVYSVGGKHIAVTESDVYDYPTWYLTREADKAGVVFNSSFAKWPTETYHAVGWGTPKHLPTGGRWIKIEKSADYLVETDGLRTFPWRTFILADKPADFCAADIIHALARPQDPGSDFSWVKPGLVAWDWWNAFDNLGTEKGCTTAGYKRFIDFAAKNGVPYVVLDEGWHEDLDIWKLSKRVDVPEIIRYGKEKGVDIVLWMAWPAAFGDEEHVARHFAELGAKGFKIDFMDRGDAEVERFLWKFADACARYKMIVDYHGSHRPTGQSRAYPNVLTYEGVRGLEYAKWHKNDFDFPDNDVKVVFLRMTAGPVDYTPGAMDHYPIGKYTGTYDNPGSVGTRCHQMAQMVLYESPFQMLADAPTKYEKNMECFSFMAKTPAVWADTVGLGGTPDTYAALARQAKDGAWYATAINNATSRTCTIETAFLGVGEWKAEIFRDAPDCDTAPEKYVHETKVIKAGEPLRFRMAVGGGYVARLTKLPLCEK